MARTIRHDTYSEQRPQLKAKRSRMTGHRQKQVKLSSMELWYEELPIVRRQRPKQLAS